MNELVSLGYLKALPGNPTTDAPEWYWNPRLQGSGSNRYVSMQLGETNGEAVCEAINRQTSGNPTIPTGPAGTGPVYCYQQGGIHLIYSEV